MLNQIRFTVCRQTFRAKLLSETSFRLDLPRRRQPYQFGPMIIGFKKPATPVLEGAVYEIVDRDPSVFGDAFD
jgi:hypothetical protein